MRAGTSSSQPFSQSSERQQGKCDAVEVVADHEIEWESCAGEVLLLPISVRTLRGTEIVCRPAAARIFSVSCGHISQKRPGRLGRGREIRAASPLGIAVGADVLAEAAALLLDGVEPADGATHRGMIMRDAARLQPGKRRSRAVDVVHAPPPEP